MILYDFYYDESETEPVLSPARASLSTSSKAKIDNILFMEKPTYSTQLPYMGHEKGTLVKLSRNWGELTRGHAMFVGIHKAIINSMTFPQKEIGVCQLSLEVVQSDYQQRVRICWVQEWLQGDKLIRENVPWMLYGDNHVEGTGGKDKHAIRK